MARIVKQKNGVIWFSHCNQMYGSTRVNQLLNDQGLPFFSDRIVRGEHWSDFGTITSHGVAVENAEIIFNSDGSLSIRML